MYLLDEPKQEVFHICDDTSANWYLRKLANLESEKQRVMAQAAQIVKQLESDAEGLRFLYENELQEYVRKCLAANGNRRKSLHFLQGTAAFRTVPAGVKIADMNAALHHALTTCPDAVKSVPTLDAGKYRREAEKALQNGELLPGVETTPEREAFTVRFGKTD